MKKPRAKKRAASNNDEGKEVRHHIRKLHSMGLRFVSGSIRHSSPGEEQHQPSEETAS